MGISIESIYLLLNQKADRNEIIARQLSELREQITNLQGSIDLCQMILEDKIIDHEQIDYYLSYIHEEEEKGKRFSEVVELLEDIDDFTQSSLIYWRPWVLHFTRWPWITTLLSTAFWFTILTIPISHIIEVYLGKEKLSVPLLVIFGSILFIFGSNFIKYRKSNRKSR